MIINRTFIKGRLLLVLFGLLTLCGCQPENRVYAKHKKLSPDLEWLKKDIREFDVSIEDTGKTYTLGLTFRYANGYQYDVAKVQVTEISPSGKQQINTHDLKIRSENGEYIGEAGYDIWDSEHVIEPDKQYAEQGVYTYKVKHIMPHDPLHYAMEIGVILDVMK